MRGIVALRCRQLGKRRYEQGASLLEFSVVGLSVILAGLFNLQLVLLYHANTTVNYATFEAARTGAVNNASLKAMKTELGIRLAPLQGGDGSQNRALSAITQSSVKVHDPLNTRVLILNPTREAFKDWGIEDPDTGEYFIPVNQLRHQAYSVGQHSGLSLRDANLLKLQVTHGVDLRVPVVGKLMAGPMKWLDSENAAYYLRGKWPIQSVATVRMQSDSLKSEIFNSPIAEPGSTTGAQGGVPNSSGGAGGESESGEADNAGPPITTTPDSSAPAPPVATECPDEQNESLRLTGNGHIESIGELLMNTSAFRQRLARRDMPVPEATGL